MDYSRLIQGEIRRGATQQEIQELTKYLHSGKFNYQQFSSFLADGTAHLSAPPASKSRVAAHTSIPIYNPASIPASTSGSSDPVKGKAAPKRKRAKKDEGEGSAKKEAPEKRGAVYRKAPSRAILERADRVKSQRMFLISRGGRSEVPTKAPSSNVKTEPDTIETPPTPANTQQALSESFEVLGSTGNCYTVVISKNPSCSCPDFEKGNICKHLVFVYLRVLRIPEELPYWYQKALLTSELEILFENAVEDPTTRVADHVKRAWEANTGRSISGKADGVTEGEEGKKRIPVEGDQCPICFESFIPGATRGITFCLHSCGNGLHDPCFKSYSAARRTQQLPVICVFCRQPMVSANDSAIGINSEGYLNLGAAAGLSSDRDTSSYYHGPRRGERYYDDQEARYNPSGYGMGVGWGGY